MTSSGKSLMLLIVILTAFIGCSQKSTKNDNIPNPPLNLRASALSSNSVELEWADNSDNETAFIIYGPSFVEPPERFMARAVLPAGSTTFTDSVPFDSTLYQYYVIARNDIGDSAPSDTATVVTRGIGLPPEVPHDPLPANRAIGIDINPVLTWQDSDPDGDDLLNYFDFGTSPEPPQTNVVSPSLSFTPGSLEYETTYYWRVRVSDNHHHITLGPVWSFTTRNAP